MRWNIGGAGVAGSYLYGRMKAAGFEVTLFDPKRPDFYIPCGFATNKNAIMPFLKRSSISLEEISEAETGKIWISGNNFEKTEFNQNGLCTINKMKMEELMRGSEQYQRAIISGREDPIIDCTGISRAYLGKASEDFTMFAIEKVCEKSPYDGFYFDFFKNGRGYFWSFPLKGKYHIGAGGVDLMEVRSYIEPYKSEKILSRKIRMKPLMGQETRGIVFGVGESIGYISPLLGEGIVPALENAEIFFQIISKEDDLNEIKVRYKNEIRSRMKKFQEISQMVLNIQSGRTLTRDNLLAVPKALKELKNFGIKPDFLKILRHFL
ncbi:hypothetical protein ACNF40_06180 [Cuniculiplasma sp. SKW4]|uniref:hypothetical protein n=1 Tax=Cuniculiplasma sp. SKW4 TaxID=3400171 RepID=UPI003FD62369